MGKMVNLTDIDIGLKDINLDTLPRLKELRRVHFTTKPEVCVELPLNMTKYMRELDNPADSPELRAAKRMKYVLENKTGDIQDNCLFAGKTTTKTKGVIIYPQFMGLSMWPELETMSTRKKNQYNISRENIDLLNYEVFPFWMDSTIQEVCRRDNNNPLCQRMVERLVFYLATKAHVISHTIPDYEIVVEEGLGKIKEDAVRLRSSKTDQKEKDFFEAVITVIDGVLAYAQTLSRKMAKLAEREEDPERKKELELLSDICKRVPEKKPETFYEGLQAIWICQVCLHQENNNIALSLGRIDQMLYPLYRHDMENDRLDPERAVELMGCFYLRLVDNVPMSPETAEELFGGSGSNEAITLGGIDADGNDAVNDLTYVTLRATELLGLRDPNANARYCPGVNSIDYLRRLCEVNYSTKATPCFHNDVEVVKALVAQDYSLEDARNYAIVGCVEPIRGGSTFGHTGAIMFNLASVLELALFQGKHRITGDEQFGASTPPPATMTSFDQFLAAFETQLDFLAGRAVEMNNIFGETHRKVHPLPLLSTLTKNSLEKGKDILDGGAKYNTSGVAVIGLAEVVDSLCAIEEFVMKRQEVEFKNLLTAIENDWEGEEPLRQKILNSGQKFGTTSSEAAEKTNYLLDLLHANFQRRENYRGGKYTVGYWTMTTHAGWGLLTGALPSGRKNKEVLPSGMTPVSRQAPVLNEVFEFVAKLDATKIPNSHALNIKYTPARDPEQMIPKFAASVDAFMKMGGLQVQFNLTDRATFEDARDNPEKYPELLVRVSGYTAYFTDLNPHMQKEIIIRAEYDLNSGMEV
jgi:pyruvate formate-lyase/glycerol dehydratase family glycyl radical enzyme